MTDSLQIVSTIALACRDKVLRCSGQEGVLIRPFHDTPQDRDKYKVVPLDLKFSVQEAKCKADLLGDLSVCLTTCGKGFGVCVLTQNHEQCAKTLYPQDWKRFLGEKWTISGLPCSCGGLALQRLLEDWEVFPLHTYRVGDGLRATRTWVVRSAQTPPKTLLPHSFGLACVKKWEPPVGPSRPVQVFSQPKQCFHVAKVLPRAWGPKSEFPLPATHGNGEQRQGLKRRAEATDAPMEPVQASMAPAAATEQPDLVAIVAAAVLAALTPLTTQVNAMQQEFAALRAPVDFYSTEAEINPEEGEVSQPTKGAGKGFTPY